MTGSTTGAATTAALVHSLPIQGRSTPRIPLIDVNFWLGSWPLRRLPDDSTTARVERLRRHGVTEAWAGAFEGLLHKDLGAVNAALADTCRRQRTLRLRPFGSVNPRAPDWEEELRRCAQEHRMPGIRLHPNYHGYRLEDPNVSALLEAADQLGLIVQLVVVMEDERMMHPLLRVDPVDTAPLRELVRQRPRLRLLLLNALRTLRARPLLELLAASPNVGVEIAQLEGVGGLEALLAQAPATQVFFGSHAPLFYFEAARLKLQESVLSAAADHAIREGNAQRWTAARG